MKRTLVTAGIMLCTLIILFSYQPVKQTPPEERTFTIIIPAVQGQAMLDIIQGNLNMVNAKDFKTLSESVIGQIYYQDRQYYIQDSLAKVKDTTAPKNKKP